jgi:hypothetical protein
MEGSEPSSEQMKSSAKRRGQVIDESQSCASSVICYNEYMDATIDINAEELDLLTYLREHATGYTPEDVLERQELSAINEDLNLTEANVRKLSTYLASFGLVGVRKVDFPSNGSYEITGIGITGFGENYMRQLQAALDKEEPGKFHKLTTATVKASGAIILPIASKVLTDYAGSHLQELGRIISNLWR